MKKIDKYIKSLIQVLILIGIGETVLDWTMILFSWNVPKIIIGLIAIVIITGILWGIDILWEGVFE